MGALGHLPVAGSTGNGEAANLPSGTDPRAGRLGDGRMDSRLKLLDVRRIVEQYAQGDIAVLSFQRHSGKDTSTELL